MEGLGNGKLNNESDKAPRTYSTVLSRKMNILLSANSIKFMEQTIFHEKHNYLSLLNFNSALIDD